MSINEGLQNIQGVTKLEAEGMSFPGFYKRHGFMVHRQAIPMDLIKNANIGEMKSLFSAAEPDVVFNARPVEEIKPRDAERLQLVTKKYTVIKRDIFTEAQKLLLKTCERTVVEKVKKLLSNIKKFKTIESVLYSRPNSHERQKLHADLSDELADHAALALIALEPNTTFVMCKNSHQEAASLQRLNMKCLPQVYELNVGDILIFHPNLIHGGDKYIQDNLRLHYYVIDKLEHYELDTSFPVDVDITRKYFALQDNRHRRVQGALQARIGKAEETQKRSKAGFQNVRKRWMGQF